LEPLLRVDNLETSFFTKAGALKAVNGVSYEIHAGTTLGIVGESGCGKSVTSYSIMGLLSPPGAVTGGKILFQGQDLVKSTESELRKVRGNRIAMIFQEPMTALNPVLRIGTQITEQIEAHERALSPGEARNRAIEMLGLVGIPAPEKRVDAYPHQLSGGMRQRAMIAMALSCKPDLLIADEPTTALDVTIQAQILGLLQELQEKLGMAIQFITHDLGVISEISDRVLVMYAGSVVEEAPSAELFSHPRHPYTVGLMNSILDIEKNVDQLNTIPGTVPHLANLPQGCSFQNRCGRVREACKAARPPLETVGNRKLACFNPWE
jgi:peptide/nickel transport system ATP-binding protein